MVRRNIETPVRLALADTPVVLINGARQTGKTTLARAIATGTGAQYFTLDDSTTLSLATSDPAGFIRNLSGPVVIDEIQRQGVTMFFGVPTIYIALLGANVPKAKLASIRYYFSAAATMPQEISRRWTETYGPAVHEGYGLTECSPFACYNDSALHRFGSVGRAVHGFELKIFDDQDKELPAGQQGEIVIRGEGVMQGYWNRPDESAHALRGGWLHTGDVGRMDADGYVFITDRVKDMINVSGFKVWPAEVENYLYQIPQIKEVAVFGLPDPLKGESVCAAVVLKDGAQLTPEFIIDWCREKLAAYKAPARIDIVKELPKSATGKILKRMLRQQ